MTKSPVIYKRDSEGRLRSWEYEIDGPGSGRWRTISGLVGGTLTTSAWTTCKGKQKRSDDGQAQFEANAAFSQKLAREYRALKSDLDSVPTSPMLAHKYADLKKPLTFPVFSQPKLDGIRCTLTRHGAFSRDYQPILNVEHIRQALAPAFADDPDLSFDGELYNHDMKADFGAISSIVRKQKPTPEQRAIAAQHLQYHVYDFGMADYSFAERLGAMKNYMGLCAADCIRWVITHEVLNQDRLDELYGMYLEQGYEGQMVRLNAPYEFDKRSKSLLKRKEFLDGEFRLLRIEEGQGNWAGYAKRCVFELPDGRECGAGIRGTQEQMKSLLSRTQQYGIPLEYKVTIRYFTPSPDGVPRFPVATDFHFGGRVD